MQQIYVFPLFFRRGLVQRKLLQVEAAFCRKSKEFIEERRSGSNDSFFALRKFLTDSGRAFWAYLCEATELQARMNYGISLVDFYNFKRLI